MLAAAVFTDKEGVLRSGDVVDEKHVEASLGGGNMSKEDTAVDFQYVSTAPPISRATLLKGVMISDSKDILEMEDSASSESLNQ